MQILLVGLLAAALLPSSSQGASSSVATAYEAFRREHGERRERDHLGYEQRLALFERNAETVRLHNAKPDRSWTAGLNRFTDYSDEEFHALLGHKPGGRRPAAVGPSGGSSFLQLRPSQVTIAESMDWRKLTNSTIAVQDQGACGSCWAVAAAGGLVAHAQLALNKKGSHIQLRPLSYEQMVDCTPNPNECGGKGGCEGATAELGFEYARENGIGFADDYKGYQHGGDGKCKPVKPAVLAQGFIRLPVNNLQALLNAVATKGPVVVSVYGGFSNYQTGVYSGCDKDAIVNHAVLAVGYGNDAELKKPYWLVRNSWGPKWGEAGYIRMLRHLSDEDAYCGTDNKPLEGTGCKDGPSEMPVCGMCGILSDSAYPEGVTVATPEAM